MYQFPKVFFMGEFDLGPQTEGRFAQDGKGDNLWDYWYKIEPNRFYQGQDQRKHRLL